MEKKQVSGILHILFLIGLLTLVFSIQQLKIAPEISAEAASIPPFVTENKLVYESGVTYQWLDPHVSYYQFDYWTLWHSVETLFWYERDNATKIIPWLAVSEPEVSADRLHYNITLRQGITFQDGTPFNATAVWFSLNRLLIIDAASGDGVIHGSQAAWIVEQLLDTSLFWPFTGYQTYDSVWVKTVLDQNFVEILDDYKVRLNLLTPTTQFLPVMAGPWASIVSPASTIQMDYAEYPAWGAWDGNYTNYFLHMAGLGETGLVLPENGWRVGTGPYYVESVQPTTPYKIVLKAYDDYWGGPNNMNLPPAGKTRIETIEYNYIPSFATRLLDLEAGTATGIAVPTSDIFQVVDRDKWIDEGILESTIPGVTMHGPFSQFTTWWLCFSTNVSRSDGALKDWQPFADWRIRMAVACSINITDMNINANNRLGIVADNIIPPDTLPIGSYNTTVKPTFSFNLTKTSELLLVANATPLTSFKYYNGAAIPAGMIDNSFGSDYVHAKVVEFYVHAGATAFQQVLTAMAHNLNTVAEENDLGIRFNVVIVPGGQQYTLASAHLIDSYMAGWIADYNHVLNWLGPMYMSTGVYFSWNRWNLTALDTRYAQAVAADQAGNVAELLRLNTEMNTIANDALTYMVWWHPTAQFARSTWLQGWYVNTVYGVDLWSTMYYEQPEKLQPIAAFTYTPPTPFVTETVVFNASDSYDSDGIINSYTWDFGDNTIITETDPIITHSYTTAGTYTVTLTVTDNDELVDTTISSITIGKLSSAITISASPTTITIDEHTFISGSISPTRAGATVTIWDRLSGDAIWNVLAAVTSDGSSQYSYTWMPSEIGIYELKANWTGDENTVGAESSTTAVIALPPPPQKLLIKLSGEFDYLHKETVRIKIVALIRDATTMEHVSNANVAIDIYDDAGNLWISSVMTETHADTGIYEWWSTDTIRELRLEKGIYLVHVKASIDNGPVASDVLLFHIDPPSESSTPFVPLLHYVAAAIALVAGTIVGIALFKRKRKQQADTQ